MCLPTPLIIVKRLRDDKPRHGQHSHPRAKNPPHHRTANPTPGPGAAVPVAGGHPAGNHSRSPVPNRQRPWICPCGSPVASTILWCPVCLRPRGSAQSILSPAELDALSLNPSLSRAHRGRAPHHRYGWWRPAAPDADSDSDREAPTPPPRVTHALPGTAASDRALVPRHPLPVPARRGAAAPAPIAYEPRSRHTRDHRQRHAPVAVPGAVRTRTPHGLRHGQRYEMACEERWEFAARRERLWQVDESQGSVRRRTLGAHWEQRPREDRVQRPEVRRQHLHEVRKKQEVAVKRDLRRIVLVKEETGRARVEMREINRGGAYRR